MRLGVHYHVPIKKEKEQYWTPYYYGVFLDSLAKRYSNLVVFYYEPLDSEISLCDYSLQEKAEFHSLGRRITVPLRILKGLIQVRRMFNLCDLLLIRYPTPLFIVLPFSGNIKKAVPYVVGDYWEAIKDLPLPKKLAFSLINLMYKFTWFSIRPSNLTLTNSNLLLAKLNEAGRNAHLVKSSTLRNVDIPKMRLVNYENGLKVFYCGRISFQKGLHNLIDAISKLHENGVPVSLRIAGFTMGGDLDYQTKLIERINQNPAKKKIEFLGFLKGGEELSKEYQLSNVFVIPSISDFEGFPRAIWEAMAHSVPVVACGVGSIPSFLQNEKHAIILKPDSVNALVNGLNRIYLEEELRNNISKGGYHLAKSNTVDISAEKMLDFLQKKNVNVA